MILRKIDYQGFTTTFKILSKIKKHLEEKGISPESLVKYSASEWYEMFLFDIIDEDQDGIPEEKFGKSFEVVYYEVIDKWVKGKEFLFTEKYDFPKSKYFSTSMQIVGEGKNKVGIRSILLKK